MSDQLSIISSEVMEMFYEPDNFLIIQRWKGGGLDEEKFKQTILQVNEQGERMANMGMKVLYEIIVPQFSFMVPPDLQEWAAEQTKRGHQKSGASKNSGCHSHGCSGTTEHRSFVCGTNGGRDGKNRCGLSHCRKRGRSSRVVFGNVGVYARVPRAFQVLGQPGFFALLSRVRSFASPFVLSSVPPSLFME